ncbi:hypothetical protein ACN28C_27255 [Plantactinospora sp. WMMC1484]
MRRHAVSSPGARRSAAVRHHAAAPRYGTTPQRRAVRHHALRHHALR